MGSYTERDITTCKWCCGEGAYYYGSYTSDSEEEFRCLTCGQHYYAEGDYLEHTRAAGGFGVILAKSMDGQAPLARRLFVYTNCIQDTYVLDAHYYAYQLGQNQAVNNALVAKLGIISEWVVRISFDRNIAPSSESCRYDLTQVSKCYTVETGSPPLFEEIMAVMLQEYRMQEPTSDPAEDTGEEIESGPEIVPLSGTLHSQSKKRTKQISDMESDDIPF